MGTISPTLGVIIMMNNYFHDVATALLMASGWALWVIYKRYNALPDEIRLTPASRRYFISLYHAMTTLAKFALLWIIVGGVPRTLFYRSFEWANAVQHVQIPALIVKHILAFAFVGTGAHIWMRISREIKILESEVASDTAADTRSVPQE